MVTASFDVELPPDVWIREVSRVAPDARLRLLSGMAVEGGSVELGEVVAENASVAATAVADAIASHEDVTEFEELFVADQRVLAQYATEEASLYGFLEEIGAPPEFPIVVEDGWFAFDVTAPRDQIGAIEATLDASGLEFEVRSVLERPEPDAMLTDRQREFLEVAFAAGYYEVPRACTLRELAADLDVDPSTASGILRRAEQRIVAWFLTAASEGPVARS